MPIKKIAILTILIIITILLMEVCNTLIGGIVYFILIVVKNKYVADIAFYCIFYGLLVPELVFVLLVSLKIIKDERNES